MSTSSPELSSHFEEMVLDLQTEIRQKLTRKMTAIKNMTMNNPENSRKLIEER